MFEKTEKQRKRARERWITTSLVDLDTAQRGIVMARDCVARERVGVDRECEGVIWSCRE